MLEIIKISEPEAFNEKINSEGFVDFLFTHLDEFGDPREDIKKSIDYAFSKSEGKGGFLLAAFMENEVVGTLVMNKTGMAGYVPENILVYVAVNNKYRGKGIGRQIIEKAIEEAKGNVKLHVEYDNPAKVLYERIGFKNKYADMRFNK